MALYTVLIPGGSQSDRDPMAATFVKEGFAWPALFFALPWLIFRRLWLVLIGYLIASAAIGLIGYALGDGFTEPSMVLLQFLFALEANELRRWTLGRHGYRLVAVVEGRDIEEAEIRYFAGGGAAEAGEASPPSSTPPPAPPPTPQPQPLGAMPPSAEAGDVIGLFPAPGARA